MSAFAYLLISSVRILIRKIRNITDLAWGGTLEYILILNVMLYFKILLKFKNITQSLTWGK